MYSKNVGPYIKHVDLILFVKRLHLSLEITSMRKYIMFEVVKPAHMISLLFNK